MNKAVRRGYLPQDEIEFHGTGIRKLQKAALDLYYLLNHGYPIKGASVFVGNHYLLSERQRLSLVRAISSEEQLLCRKSKELEGSLTGSVLHIDGFNTIITLEVALSDSTLIQCMDGTIRDLAGLRGTYRLIDKTDLAITWLGKLMEKKEIKKACFYLDAPVSNSGRLRERIHQLLSEYRYEVEVQVISNVDSVLSSHACVVTSDAIILDHCISFINLTSEMIEEKMNCKIVDFVHDIVETLV